MENEIIINGVTYVKKEEKKQNERANGIWFIDTNGDIHLDKDEATDKHKPFCYPTESDCIKARDKILALYRIKSYCEEQWGEFIPDWDDPKQIKHFITYNNKEKQYKMDSNEFVQKLLPFYLANLPWYLIDLYRQKTAEVMLHEVDKFNNLTGESYIPEIGDILENHEVYTRAKKSIAQYIRETFTQ